ncbi:MAG: hypothetical protein IPO08_19045 [Xanthomonadales bacterium]|nr:hypothetical protein [Xanthomonadales bacterium]
MTTKTTTVQVLPPLQHRFTLDDLQLSVGAFTSPPAFNPELHSRHHSPDGRHSDHLHGNPGPGEVLYR